MNGNQDLKQKVRHSTDFRHIKKSGSEYSGNEHQLDKMYRLSRRGMWGVFGYLILSAVAYYFREQSLSGVLPEQIMRQLGYVPPVFMAVGILWLSTCSALIVIAGNLYHNAKPSGTLSHLLFRMGIFLLFFVVGGLNQYYHEIFLSGLIVMALQHHNVFSYYTSQIESEFECLQLPLR